MAILVGGIVQASGMRESGQLVYADCAEVVA